MCLIAIALRANERFPLVVAGNRDEFLGRPTLPLDHWKSAKGTVILGGRDAQDGGTWMGFTPAGRFAMLTNVRNPQFKAPAQPISRGRLVVDWLDSHLDARDWSQPLDASQFNGFNLIAGDWTLGEYAYLSHPSFLKENRLSAGIKYGLNAIELVVNKMPTGSVDGLSNAALNTAWPKTEQLKNSLHLALQLESTPSITDALLHALADSQAAPDAVLPDTGVPLELERALSSAFVSHPSDQPIYGTRTSWVAVVESRPADPSTSLLTLTEITHSHEATNRQPPVLRQQTMPWPA